MLCVCAPAGQDEYFTAAGVSVESRTGGLCAVSKEEAASKQKVGQQLSAKYRIEMLDQA